jgi:Tfp pilus assembly protein PilN
MNKQIAAELCLSEITIKANRSHLMKKMRAKTFAELVRMEASLKDAASKQEKYATVYGDHQMIEDSSQVATKRTDEGRRSIRSE